MDEIITIQIPWHPPQDIKIKCVGEAFVLSLIDRLGRRVFFEGRDIGYRVRVFRSRVYQSVSEIIVHGPWDSAIYRDYQGNYHAVIIHGKKDQKTN